MQDAFILRNADLSGSGLPIGPIVKQLIALPDLTHFYRPRATDVTLVGGDIDSFTDLKGAQPLSAYGADFRPTLIDNVFGAQPGAKYTLADADRCVLSGAQPDWSQPWTLAFPFKFGADLSTTQVLMGSNTSAAARTIVIYDTASGGTSIRLRVGSSSIGVIGLSPTIPNYVIVSFDGSHLRAWANGTDISPINFASGSVGTGAFTVGAISGGGGNPFDGAIGPLMMFDSDVLGDDDATVKNMVISYFREVLGYAA